MILTPGQLYFISEKDVKTGELSSYYKIGIVRDAADRDSTNRLLEHQTGNPRQLYIVESLTMPAVEAIETNLHYLFARNRVMGEWMSFTDTELKSAINRAKELATEMEANLPDYEKVEKLGKTISDGSKIPPSTDSEYWFGVYHDHKQVLDACNEVLNAYDEYLLEGFEQGVVVPGVATVQQRAGAKKFDEKLFAEKYPDLYKEYSLTTSSMKASFRVSPAKDWQMDISVIGSEQVDLILSLKEALEGADHSIEAALALHEKHLGVREVEKYSAWQIDIAKLKLQVLTGESDGIEKQTSWKRELVEKSTLDRNALKQKHLEEFNACVVEGNVMEALIVGPRAVSMGGNLKL